MPEVVDTLVIGAGPAGLTCAYTLAKQGRGVAVLEQDPDYVGGISRTVNYKGFLFDIGGHRFFSKSEEIVRLWDEILPDDFIERPRLSRIYYNGRFFSYPLKAFEALSNLGLIESVACVVSFIYARARPIRDPRSFHDWVRNQFGERLFRIFFQTYTEKVWGMNCDDISADWAAQRIKGLSLASAIVDAVRRSCGLKRPAGAPKTLIEAFRYPRKGPGMMWEAAAEKVRELGGKVSMGIRVKGLNFDSRSKLWIVYAENKRGQTEYLQCRNVVSSAPLKEVVEMLEPIAGCRHKAAQLKYRDFITVVLIGKASHELPDNWIYIHDPTVKVGRVQNFKSWSPEMVPDGESICLGLEYFCFEGDGLWTTNDVDLVALAKREIQKLGLMDQDEVSDACVVRQSKAYPVYDDAYKSRVNEIRQTLAADYPSLHVVGRNGMHKYNNQDHAMMTGMLSALNILAGEKIHDIWRVNEDAEYTEAGHSGSVKMISSDRLVPTSVGNPMLVRNV